MVIITSTTGSSTNTNTSGQSPPNIPLISISSNNHPTLITTNLLNTLQNQNQNQQNQITDMDDDGCIITSSSDSDSDSESATDLLSSAVFDGDDVTCQLAAAGPIGMAAAAAIASVKKRKRPHSFETNPSIRKRQQTRLLRKLRQTIDEFTLRVGMQAVVLVAIPGKQNNSYKCFGAKPLEDVVKNLRPVVIQDLEAALALATPMQQPEDPNLHELPPLVIDGIPTPVEKMTQAQLRAFIPLMLKYSTGRGKPGWGKESTRPGWWPDDLPWANVRMDARSEDEKQKVSWTHALRQIVINCYRYHGREDLLPVFSGEQNNSENVEQINVDVKPAKLPKIITPITTNMSIPHGISMSTTSNSTQLSTEKMYQIVEFLKQQQGQNLGNVTIKDGSVPTTTTTVLQTIQNSDGTVSVLHVEPGTSIITLPDGTQAHVQGVATLQHGNTNNGNHSNQSSSNVLQPSTINIDLSQIQHLDHTQQLIITGEDGQAYPVTVSGMISVPLNQQQQGGGGHQFFTTNTTTAMGTGSESSQQHSQVQQQLLLMNDRRPRYRISKNVLARAIHNSNNNNNKSIITAGAGPSQQPTITTPPQHQQQLLTPKLEPLDSNLPTQIPISALTGDPTQTELISVSSTGQVVHDNKIYQICEYSQQQQGGGYEEEGGEDDVGEKCEGEDGGDDDGGVVVDKVEGEGSVVDTVSSNSNSNNNVVVVVTTTTSES